MFKKLIAKIVQSVAYQKVKLWLQKSGLTNIVYLGLAVGAVVAPLGLIGIAFLKPYLIGAFVGIFAYLNWNLVRKLWKEKIRKK